MKHGNEHRLSLGERLREIRKREGWTLNQVSAKTGLAASTLSKVENSRISLTYDNLLKLATGLGVDVAELFSTNDTPAITGRRTITRRGQGRAELTANYDYYYLCTDLLRLRMVPIVVKIKARSIEEFGELLRHSGEEFIYVLEGAIEVHTEFYEPVVLETGDSVYLDSTMGHAYIAIGDGEASVLGVCSSVDLNFGKGLASLITDSPTKTTSSAASHRR